MIPVGDGVTPVGPFVGIVEPPVLGVRTIRPEMVKLCPPAGMLVTGFEV